VEGAHGRATSASRNFGQHPEHLDMCSLTDEICDDAMMTRASLDPIFLQKMRKRFRGDRPPDERACEYSTSCIDMRADELLISAEGGVSQQGAAS